MDKCREAFENSLGHTDGFHDGYVTYNPITGMYESNDDDYECVADWLNGALSVWQSRQAEVDQLQSQINEMAEVGLSQESVIREKDKRVEELESRLKAVHALARMRSVVINADRWFTLRPHIKNAIKCLDRKEKALRGEYE